MSVFISIWNGDVTLFEHILCVNVWASIALWFAFNWKENQTKKEWVTIKPEENSSGKMWINICNNRQMSWRGYPIHNTIMLLFPQENKNTILKLYQTWQGSGLSFGQKTEPGPLQLLTEVQAIVCFFFSIPLCSVFVQKPDTGTKGTCLPLTSEILLHVSLSENNFGSYQPPWIKKWALSPAPGVQPCVLGPATAAATWQSSRAGRRQLNHNVCTPSCP